MKQDQSGGEGGGPGPKNVKPIVGGMGGADHLALTSP